MAAGCCSATWPRGRCRSFPRSPDPYDRRPIRRQAPLRREPVVDRRVDLPELLLDPGSPGHAWHVRVGQPGVLRYLAFVELSEQIVGPPKSRAGTRNVGTPRSIIP